MMNKETSLSRRLFIQGFGLGVSAVVIKLGKEYGNKARQEAEIAFPQTYPESTLIDAKKKIAQATKIKNNADLTQPNAFSELYNIATSPDLNSAAEIVFDYNNINTQREAMKSPDRDKSLIFATTGELGAAGSIGYFIKKSVRPIYEFFKNPTINASDPVMQEGQKLPYSPPPM